MKRRADSPDRNGAARRPPQERVPFFVHVDEFQTFSSDAFATLLSEARKFALHFCLENQFTDQLAHSVRSAVLGNAGTLIAFRVGSRDAELLAPEFHPIEPGALTDLLPFTAWLRGSDAASECGDCAYSNCNARDGNGRNEMFHEFPFYYSRTPAIISRMLMRFA